jgi:arylsulfatase A-like enzyme
MSKPNIIFFFTDDQRFNTIRAINNPEISTPNLDQIVARGTTFLNGYIMGGSCGAVCMPSRAMLHTGRTLYRIERQGQGIPEGHALLGETLQRAGYTSFGTGKWHNGPRSYARSFNAGAEIFFGGMSDHWNIPACDFDPTGEYAMTPKIDNPGRSNEVTWRRCNHIKAGRHSSDLFADAAIDFIESDQGFGWESRGLRSKGRQGDKPFFMYISFMAPHDPRSMPEQFLKMYDPEQVRLPENFMPEHPFDNGWMRGRDELLAGFPRTEQEVRRHIAEYYAMISHLDDAIGRVTAELADKGVLQNTIIVFAGDNGLAVGQHGLMGKQSVYDHSVHVPLIFAGPGIPQGERREAFAYLLDIFPTLCDLVEIEIPETVEGKSLVPAMKKSAEPIREYLHFAYEGFHRGVRDRQYKLIEYVVGGKHVKTQLFDLANDPRETVNLADSSKHAETLARLREELRKWQTDYGDTQEQGQEFWNVYDA